MSASYLLRRILWAIPTLLGVAVLVFVLVRVVPGDPVAMMIPPGATAADIAGLRHRYGLDAPIYRQFLIWFGELAGGTLGNSISLRVGVAGLILSRLPATLELVLLATAVAVSSAILLAITAVRLRGLVEAVFDGLTGIALAIPDFLWGLLFILVFGVLIPVLPITGRIDPTLAFEPQTGFYLLESALRGEWTATLDLIRHLLLPTLALALPLMAALARVLKSSLLEVMQQDYVTLAWVKGYSRSRILWRVALRNAVIPALTLTGVQFAFLIGGTVLIEHIYAYPGIGNLAIAAVLQRDLPLIQGLVLTFAVLFIVTNLLVDLAYTLVNPRVRQA